MESAISETNVRGDYEPRVFFEFGMPSTASNNTEPQLFSYDNITAGEIDEDRWLYSPGAAVRLQDNSAHSVSGMIELFAYHTVV